MGIKKFFRKMSNIQETAFILNTASATDLSAIRDRARWVLSDQLNFKDSKKVTLAVKRFSYTNWFENIFASGAENAGYLNTIYYSDDAGDGTKYSLTIPQGSYTVLSLSNTISELLAEAGHDNIFTLYGSTSENKCYFIFNEAGWYIYMHAVTPYLLLGFDEFDYVPADKSSSVNEVVYAPNKAEFNYIETIKVRSNLSWGIIDGTNRSNLLAELVPNTTVGSIHAFEPVNLTWSDSMALKAGVSTLEIWLQDEAGDALPLSENWTIELLVRAIY